MTDRPVEAILTRAELRERYGIPFSKTHIRRLEQAGKFPAREALSSRTPVWRESAIREWVAKTRPATLPAIPNAGRPRQASA